jgi:hypothetical protein
MVEAAAIARAKEDGMPDWNALMDHEQARYRAEAGTSLRAALALAEAEGVVLVRVPGERPLARHRQPGETVEHDVGYNSCRAATLAGRVEV